MDAATVSPLRHRSDRRRRHGGLGRPGLTAFGAGPADMGPPHFDELGLGRLRSCRSLRGRSAAVCHRLLGRLGQDERRRLRNRDHRIARGELRPRLDRTCRCDCSNRVCAGFRRFCCRDLLVAAGRRGGSRNFRRRLRRHVRRRRRLARLRSLLHPIAERAQHRCEIFARATGERHHVGAYGKSEAFDCARRLRAACIRAPGKRRADQIGEPLQMSTRTARSPQTR